MNHLLPVLIPLSLYPAAKYLFFFLTHSNIKSVALIINPSWWISHLRLSLGTSHILRNGKSNFKPCVYCIWCVSFSIYWDEEWGKSHPGSQGLEKLDFLCSCVKLRFSHSPPLIPVGLMRRCLYVRSSQLCLYNPELTVNDTTSLWRGTLAF